MDDTFIAQKLHGIFVVDLAEISSATVTTTPQTTTLTKTSLSSYADLVTKESKTDISYTNASKSKRSSVLSLKLLKKKFKSSSNKVFCHSNIKCVF